MEITKEECAKCGACCAVAAIGMNCRVVLLPGDAERLTEEEQKWLVDRGHRKAIGLKENDEGEKVCLALEGTIGTDAGCSVHDRKPRLCVEAKMGSSECLQARKRYEL